MTTPLAFPALVKRAEGVPADDLEAFAAAIARSWHLTCAPNGVPDEADLKRLGRVIAEALRLAAEGVSVQELRLIIAARGDWERRS